MPFLDVNGASIYYETYGTDRAGRAPIVLIHGSTNTGQVDWRAVTPLLATEYRIIVPDCRGHGRSSNPDHSYSFKELAADVAALIRALGYERAHIIGHSNGGNVALVTLLEHPDVVQTCLPQAANAFVTSYLIDREPAVFDPDRVARDDPQWMNDMIALHGPDYWRELLQLTLREIITEPNYTPDDLAKVTRPTFVIQGANDVVNAPDRHAQFIAQHIPDAELWIPPNIAHSVHLEIPLEWLARVLDFLKRRGDEANDALYRLRQAHYADTRETIFDIRSSPLLPYPHSGGTAGRVGEGAGVRLTGRVLTEEQHQAAREVLPATPVDDQIAVLLTDESPWALVNRSVSDVRRVPDGLAEQVSQLLVGESARVLDVRGSWSLVRAERDGYIGWTRSAALQLLERKAVRAYQKAAKVLVQIGLAPAFDRPAANALHVGALPFGAALPLIETRRGWAAVRLPDERVWWVKEANLLPLADRPKPNAAGITFTLDLIRPFVGIPYQWGGRSPYGYDCSGLAQTFWAFMGVQIPRDADQQFHAGKLVKGTPRPGDLLFFGGDDSDLADARHHRITHVAISLGGDELIHANGGSWNIAYHSLDPASPIYRADLRDSLAGVRRY